MCKETVIKVVNVQEEVTWLEGSPNMDVNYDTLKSWLVIGPKKLTMDDETHFCDPTLLASVLKAKTILDEFEKPALQEARSKANPFESIRSAFFMNRAALKMANIDAATNFMFTEIERNPFHSSPKGPFYFADVCAGPGGFTEYILWRKKWQFKGFGLTLKIGKNDFKVNESSCASGATFQPLYGAADDGNIFYPKNIESFRDTLLHDTKGEGVHFMMSDGGFSVEGNENLQEILSKQLYVCQCLTALEIVRPHGHFVSKLFDVFTPFSAGLLYLMHLSFEKITLLKPNASRPANSERYLICYGLKKTKQTFAIRKYLRKIVYTLWDMYEIQKNNQEDIRYIVPLEILKSDDSFMEFIIKINNRIGKNQIVALMKMAEFCMNSNLVETRQANLRSQCLKYWCIPDHPKNYIPSITKADIAKLLTQDVMFTEAKLVNNIEDVQKMFEDCENWSIVPMYTRKGVLKCKCYAATSGSVVYRYEKSKWVKETDVNIRLVQGTILYGELVTERTLFRDELAEIESKSLHVIDALRLGNISLADLSFNERQPLIEMYCQAVNFECNMNTIRVRPKITQSLSNVVLNGLPMEYNFCEKNYFSILPTLGINALKEYYFVNSFLFLKTSSNQTFSTTYVLRRQLFNEENENDSGLSFLDFINYVKNYK